MRVAVTGASGYLGRAVVPALLSMDEVDEVVAIDLRPPSPVPGVIPVERDVRDPALAGDVAGAAAVLHLAFRVLGRPDDAWDVNVEGSRNVFAATAAAGAGTLLHASSGAAYGCHPDNPVPLTEDSPLRPFPEFYYPETKVEAERILDGFERENPGMRVVRVRPVSTLGPGAPVMFGGRAFFSLSDHDPPVQFLWIDDLVDAVVRLLRSDAAGAFNLGAPHPVPASRVAGLMGVRAIRAPHRLVRLAARTGGILRVPGGMDPGWVDMVRYPIVLDTSRAERELGWRASCDCAEALERFGRLVRGGDLETDPVPASKEAS